MDILWRLLFWNLLLALLTRLTPDRTRAHLVWAPLLGILFLPLQTPGQRLAAMSLHLLFAFKASLLLRQTRAQVQAMDPRGFLLYFTLWPGIDPQPLSHRVTDLVFPARWFVQGWATMIVCAVLAAGLALHQQLTPPLMLMAVLGFVHLGYSDVLSALMRLAGFPVQRLFPDPLTSRTSLEFWAKRWNQPFVELNRLFLPHSSPTQKMVVSGLLHEAALSFPAGGGWGGPLGYFLVQAALLRTSSRLLSWAGLLLPLPFLFHQPFLKEFLQPLAQTLSHLPVFHDQTSLLRFLLTAAGWGHFLVLVAGLQVPYRLGWGQELPRLRPFNRKIFWVYYGYIGSFVVLFGGLLLALREPMLSGDPASRVLLGIITLFWTARIIIDALVFRHDDWPPGPLFQIGHTLLTSLFLFIALSGWLVLCLPNSLPIRDELRKDGIPCWCVPRSLLRADF